MLGPESAALGPTFRFRAQLICMRNTDEHYFGLGNEAHPNRVSGVCLFLLLAGCGLSEDGLRVEVSAAPTGGPAPPAAPASPISGPMTEPPPGAPAIADASPAVDLLLPPRDTGASPGDAGVDSGAETAGPAVLPAPALTLDKLIYDVAQDIVVSFVNGPGNAADWIGIYEESAPPPSDASRSLFWYYTDNGGWATRPPGGVGPRNGAVTFGSGSMGSRQWPLPPGRYKAIFLTEPHIQLAPPSHFQVRQGPILGTGRTPGPAPGGGGEPKNTMSEKEYHLRMYLIPELGDQRLFQGGGRDLIPALDSTADAGRANQVQTVGRLVTK